MAQNENPRLAIIGCGALVDHHLIAALKRVGWMPSVLIDTSPDRIDVVSRRMGATGKTALKGADWREFSDEFDAALVAVPHSLHGPIGTELAKAGKHIFMEKPLATTVDQCNEMIAAAKDADVIFAVGLLRRYLNIARWMKALVASGTLGEIKRFEVREGFVFNWAISTDAALRPGLAGGGVLIDTGAHTLDLLQWWLGDFAEISYFDDADGGVEADCAIDCKLASGGTGRIELSRTRDLSDTVRIDGTNGFVEFHVSKNEIYAASPNVMAFNAEGVDPTQLEPQFFSELFTDELRDFRESVAGGTMTGIPATEGVKSIDLITRCYAARQPLKAPWADLVDSPQVSGEAPRPEIPAGSTALITGATGFIGGRLAETLVDQGVKVRCVIRNFGSATRLARMPVEIIAADLDDAEAIDKVVEGVNYVFHCAYDGRSIGLNLKGNENLINSCIAHNVSRYVYVSTFSVYEPFPDGRLDEETRDGDLGWVYCRTKLELEQQVLTASKERGLQGTIIQPAIVYGPYCKPWTNAPAEDLIYGGVVLPAPGDGLCNAIYIDDLVDGFIQSAVQPEAVGERFIMSGPEPVTWGRFFEDFARVLGTNKPEYRSNEAISRDNQGLLRDIKLVLANPKRIMQIIVRWYPARQALQAGLDAMPDSLRGLVMKHYFGSGGRQPGGEVVPDAQKLALYSAKAHVSNAKAEQMIGFKPRFDFTTGMVPTQRYLEWAYSDLRRTVERARAPEAEDLPAPADVANAG